LYEAKRTYPKVTSYYLHVPKSRLYPTFAALLNEVMELWKIYPVSSLHFFIAPSRFNIANAEWF